MIAIIDADSLVWVAAYLNRDNSNSDDLVNSIDGIITEILIATKATKYVGYIQGTEKSFRNRMFMDYKANRPPKPLWLPFREAILKEHLQRYWKFISVEGIEADDAVASCAAYCTRLELPFTVVGGDKDLRQIPGLHYNPQKKYITQITLPEAEKFLLTQLLTGDTTDNIKGVPGIGPAKAEKILSQVQPEHPFLMVTAVLNAYKTHHLSSLPKTLIDFSENAIKVTLRTDLPIDEREFIAVPDTIQHLWMNKN